MLFQRHEEPWRELHVRAGPRKGGISVLVQISSVKTRRSASTLSWYLSTGLVASRPRIDRVRSRHAFFEAELLGMPEVPHRVVVELQAATGELSNETT